ncbi:glycosyltransferase family 4 protein [Halomarina oriensis]|uniref:glycosyltransferase family 4 protein n=1 Tax=Halomarina oriensis TaxID=671145 RepID=UPI0018EEEFE3
MSPSPGSPPTSSARSSATRPSASPTRTSTPNATSRCSPSRTPPDEPTALTVGRGARYKGVDLLVEAWPRVRERHPEATLHVAGAGHPDRYDEVPGVERHGFVEEARLVELFAESALFVQPSRMDTFPVSTLEALCAGRVPVVTETAGTCSEVRALDPALVVEPTSRALAAGVNRAFDRPPGERATLAAQARERGRTFDAATRRAAFRRAFADVVRRL